MRKKKQVETSVIISCAMNRPNELTNGDHLKSDAKSFLCFDIWCCYVQPHNRMKSVETEFPRRENTHTAGNKNDAIIIIIWICARTPRA